MTHPRYIIICLLLSIGTINAAVAPKVPQFKDAALIVTVGPPRATGSKALVRMGIKNSSTEKVDSAKATVFLMDGEGRILGQTTRWVIGGAKSFPGLPGRSTTNFNFVITTLKPITTTNLTARVQFNNVIQENSRSLDPLNDVTVEYKQK